MENVREQVLTNSAERKAREGVLLGGREGGDKGVEVVLRGDEGGEGC